jgi:hypothetical protein
MDKGAGDPGERHLLRAGEKAERTIRRFLSEN